MVVKCTSAGQSIGQRAIGELLSLKKSQTKISHWATSDTPPPKFSEVTSLQAVTLSESLQPFPTQKSVKLRLCKQ